MKNILITGANRGIGLKFAEILSANNNIYATARDITNADDLKKFDNTDLLELDLLDKDSIKSFCSELKDIPLDMIINNAGIFQDEQMEETILDPELWLDEIMINAIGPVVLSQKRVHAFYGVIAKSSISQMSQHNFSNIRKYRFQCL